MSSRIETQQAFEAALPELLTLAFGVAYGIGVAGEAEHPRLAP